LSTSRSNVATHPSYAQFIRVDARSITNPTDQYNKQGEQSRPGGGKKSHIISNQIKAQSNRNDKHGTWNKETENKHSIAPRESNPKPIATSVTE
jgi:hypothetical protein